MLINYFNGLGWKLYMFFLTTYYLNIDWCCKAWESLPNNNLYQFQSLNGLVQKSISFYPLKLVSWHFVCVISGGNPHLWPIFNLIGPLEAKLVFLVILFAGCFGLIALLDTAWNRLKKGLFGAYQHGPTIGPSLTNMRLEVRTRGSNDLENILNCGVKGILH